LTYKGPLVSIQWNRIDQVTSFTLLFQGKGNVLAIAVFAKRWGRKAVEEEGKPF
jgi:hypothetical protein